MGNGMQTLIMVALAVHIITTIVVVAITAWAIKIMIPIYKPMFKQMKELYGSEEED